MIFVDNLVIRLVELACYNITAIESYFEKLGESGVTKQAFSKARKHLNPDYVRQFADATSEIAAKDEGKITYNGMPLIAINGSDIALENTPESM